MVKNKKPKTIGQSKINKYILQSEGDWDFLVFLINEFFSENIKRNLKTKVHNDQR